MKLYSVNEAYELKDTLHNQHIYIEGLLTYEDDNISLSHWPKKEQKQHSIWIEETQGAFRYNHAALKKLSNKRVVCLGNFQSKITEETVDWYWGFGHLGYWGMQIVATELLYYKKWLQANNSYKNEVKK